MLPRSPHHLQANMSAASRFIDVPELLEIILLDLPLQDLLRAQRINKTVCNTIGNSSQLQRRLFSKPTKRRQGTSALNPFLNRILRQTGRIYNGVLVTHRRPRYISEPEVVKINVHGSPHHVRLDQCIELELYAGRSGQECSRHGSYEHVLAADPPGLFNIPCFGPNGRYPSLDRELIPQTLGDLLKALHECGKEMDGCVRAAKSR